MDTSILVPALAFGTILAVLWFGVLGVGAVKREQREGGDSALGTRGDDQDGTRMLVPHAADDPDSGSRPLGSAPAENPTPGSEAFSERPPVRTHERDETRPEFQPGSRSAGGRR